PARTSWTNRRRLIHNKWSLAGHCVREETPMGWEGKWPREWSVSELSRALSRRRACNQRLEECFAPGDTLRSPVFARRHHLVERMRLRRDNSRGLMSKGLRHQANQLVDPYINKRYNADEVLNMHMALIESFMPRINPEGKNQCKQFQYCLC